MSWIQKLYETYEQCAGVTQFAGAPLLPIAHTTQQAHVEIVIDGRGGFRRASVVSRNDCTTMVPCTEESGGRSGTRPVSHPLCDKLQYVAGDFLDFGGHVTSGFAKDPTEPHREYVAGLSNWARSDYGHPKLSAVLAYVQSGRAAADLVKAGIVPTDERGRFLGEWRGDKASAPPIFGVLAGQEPEDSFVRWRIEIGDNPVSGTWDDDALVASWIAYSAGLQTKRGLCMVTGKTTTLAEQHPAKLRNAGDKAKLISSNDSSGYTFRGLLIEADEACGVSFDVTQKAHNALRWLIRRQGYRNGDQVIVSWAVSGRTIPDPFQNSRSLFFDADKSIPTPVGASDDTIALAIADVGQSFAGRLNRTISGYRTVLGRTDDVVVMAIDSATPGRMAMTFYRELTASEFLDRLFAWHRACSWHLDLGKDPATNKPLRFIGAPAPADIAEVAFGRRLDAKLRRATVERLLPCIIDGRPLPRDLVESAVRRTCNRAGLLHWEWEKSLGVACALYRGALREKDYKMTLELDRTSRDYLYGRLLAIAEHIEGRALYIAGEGRETTAARLMQRFADRPFSTWPSMEKNLVPYKTRLRAKRPGFLYKMEQLLDSVIGSFSGNDFLDDRRLSGEYLLGYHCQRQALHMAKPDDSTPNEEPNNI